MLLGEQVTSYWISTQCDMSVTQSLPTGLALSVTCQWTSTKMSEGANNKHQECRCQSAVHLTALKNVLGTCSQTNSVSYLGRKNS